MPLMHFRHHIIFLMLIAASCDQGHEPSKPDHMVVREAPVQVLVQPLGTGLSTRFIQRSFENIKKHVLGAQLSETRPMPTSAYLPSRDRYRADSLIRWLHGMAGPDQVILAITNLDISTTKDSIADWGVMGLGYQPGNACVASDFRLVKKEYFWKIALHELGHTAGLSHCPVDTCLMVDAEGHDRTEVMKDFCPSCRKQLENKGWLSAGTSSDQ